MRSSSLSPSTSGGRHSRSLALLLVAATALAGCGGGGSGKRSAPTIKNQPASKIAALGSPVTFTVTATGATSYQWFKNGSAIPGATDSSLTISSVVAGDVGTYSVAVSNSVGTTNSSGATLSLPATGAPTITTQPNSVTVPTGAPATFTVIATGGGLTYQWFKDDVAIEGATSASYSIASVSASDEASYFVRVTNASGSVDSASATLTLASTSAPRITTQPTSKSANVGRSVSFTVTATGTSPLTYQWFKNGVAIAGATSRTFTISSVKVSDEGEYTVTVTNALGSATSSAATLTVTAAPVITQQPESKTVLFNQSATFTVGVTGENLTYQWFKLGGAVVSTSPTLTLNGTPANDGTYRVKISNAAGTVTSNTFAFTVITPPTIIDQPTSITVGQGGSVSFTVNATGQAPLTYQWFKDGVAISGATAASYTIPSAAVSDAGKYKVQVSNAAGSATSSEATLTVIRPPTITNQPTSITIAAGGQATFSVTATGSGALTYQWFKNGTPISGATSSTYTISSVTASDAGTYKVVVTNEGVASTTSNNVTLTVT